MLYLIWLVVEMVVDLLKFFCFELGDVIFIGMFEGVGLVVVGDVMKVGVECFGELIVCVV